ncbi:uncharacterized protein UTRI_01722 [Ustilago trichophora]|uniref:Uncharacterized protein n=1 Tax=Ustilago trichophora TaxID=86804 RepID=A0A5C3DX38_9BASI|nr:uncharacterized protein UTRI_01722 [Ustilago trichophora]
MSLTGAAGQSCHPMSAAFSNNVSNTSESSTLTDAAGPATWSTSAASSSVTSFMDSSVTAPITEINLVSSPPTSHAASPSRRSSPLRPSTAANIPGSSPVTRELAKSAVFPAPPAQLASVVHMEEAYVVNSDPEDGTHAGETDGADTPQMLRSPSPTRSKTKSNPAAQASLAEDHLPDDGSSVYVQIPPSSPSSMMPRESSSAKKKPKKQKEQQHQQSEKSRRRGSDASDYDRPSSSSIMDDAAYAAALAAQEETLARRRPTRNARKEVSYQPNCDPEGRPLASKKDTNASGSSSKSRTSTKDSSAKKAKNKRRSRAFSDDDEEEEHDHHRSATGSSTKANTSRMHTEEDDADLTDDDVGFQARDRKKARVSNPISIDSGDEEDSPPKKAKADATSDRSCRKRIAATEEEEDNDQGAAALSNGGDDGILTPPAPTSPRRSSRKSVPSPKKQQLQELAKKQAKGRSGKTFDLEQEAVTSEKEDEEKEEEEEEEEQIRKSPSPKTAEQPPRPPSSPPPSSSSSKPAESTPNAPASVAIKRITTTSLPSPSPSTPIRGTKSFFGKPLTTLLTPNAARRPGLTRKTNIPSLLSHRGVPKPPVAKLAVSKRRMQDDDYEYDAEYEALIAKDKKGEGESGESGESDQEGDDGGEIDEGDDVEVEYD